jgi:hypothetical protein
MASSIDSTRFRDTSARGDVMFAFPPESRKIAPKRP